jgi:hypothetical protein
VGAWAGGRTWAWAWANGRCRFTEAIGRCRFTEGRTRGDSLPLAALIGSIDNYLTCYIKYINVFVFILHVKSRGPFTMNSIAWGPQNHRTGAAINKEIVWNENSSL